MTDVKMPEKIAGIIGGEEGEVIRKRIQIHGIRQNRQNGR